MSNADSDDLNVNMFTKNTKKSNITKGNVAKQENVIIKERKQRLTKNEIYKKEQDEIYDELKKMINVKKNNTFLSEDVACNNDIITGNILERMKKFHDSKMWNHINGNETKSSMKIVKKILEFHGFETISKEYNNNESRGYKYYMIPIDE
jgi:hypothetical protein